MIHNQNKQHIFKHTTRASIHDKIKMKYDNIEKQNYFMRIHSKKQSKIIPKVSMANKL